MSTAMYSGVSGLKAQGTRLDVIGNNIANISTNGYKSQSVSFSDLLSQTLSSATAPSTATNRGGTNAQQVGLGVNVAAISTNMDTGSTETTGSDMDVSIGGDGFFIVEGGGSGTYQFTRAGNFGVDTNGNLTVNGLTVCGWQAYTKNTDGTYTYDTQKTVSPINLFSDTTNGNKKVIAPSASATATLSGTLDPTSTAQGTGLQAINATHTSDSTSTMTVYDAEGNSYDVQVKLTKCYTDASTSLAAGKVTGGIDLSGLSSTNKLSITNGSNDQLDIKIGSSAAVTLDFASADKSYSSASDLVADINTAITADSSLSGKVTASLSSDGKNIIFTSVTSGSANSVSITGGNAMSTILGTTSTMTTVAGTDAYTGTGNTSWYWEAAPSDSTLSVGTPSSGYIEFNSKGKLVTGDTAYSTTPSVTLTPSSSVGAATFDVKLDLSGLSSYTTSSTTSSGSSVTAKADGYASGELQDVAIGSDGIITGSYSNGQKQPLAMLSLATFTNPEGLEKIGTNLYTTTVNSGTFTGGVAAGTSGTGKLSSGTLEGSNVDLAQEFSNMMITQRAYQANSKIITTSDEMMETLINLKR